MSFHYLHLTYRNQNTATMSDINTNTGSTTSSAPAVPKDQTRQRPTGQQPSPSTTTPSQEDPASSTLTMFLRRFTTFFAMTLGITLSLSIQSSLIYFSIRNIFTILAEAALLDIDEIKARQDAFAVLGVLSIFNAAGVFLGLLITSESKRSVGRWIVEISGVFTGGWSAVLVCTVIVMRGIEFLGRYV